MPITTTVSDMTRESGQPMDDELRILPAREGQPFRICLSDRLGPVGRAYSPADVRTIAERHGIRALHWGTQPGHQFPGGSNWDEEVETLKDRLRTSNRTLRECRGQDDQTGYVAELEHNQEICQRLADVALRLAGLEPLDT